jgi:polyribonucleotide nucleotidyltransferase
VNIIHPFGGKTLQFETDFCGQKLTIETGKLAFLADGAVTVRYGDTVVLGTAVMAKLPREGIDFFPLLVDYEERMYAAGKISGSRFIKREGRASERATLSARLIDRPIRPLFPKGFRNDVQGIATVLSTDFDHPADLVGMIAVSAALMLSGAPFEGPVAGVRIGLVDGELIAFPSAAQLATSQLDLTVAGTKDAIMMVEAGANEVDEATMIKAIELAHDQMRTSSRPSTAILKVNLDQPFGMKISISAMMPLRTLRLRRLRSLVMTISIMKSRRPFRRSSIWKFAEPS